MPEIDWKKQFWEIVAFEGYGLSRDLVYDYYESTSIRASSNINEKIIQALRGQKQLKTIILEKLFEKWIKRNEFIEENKYHLFNDFDKYKEKFIASYKEIHRKNQVENKKGKDPEFLDDESLSSIQSAARELRSELHKIEPKKDKEGIAFHIVQKGGFVLLLGNIAEVRIEWEKIRRKIADLRNLKRAKHPKGKIKRNKKSELSKKKKVEKPYIPNNKQPHEDDREFLFLQFNAKYNALIHVLENVEETEFKNVSNGEFAVMSLEAAKKIAKAKESFDELVVGHGLAYYLPLSDLKKQFGDTLGVYSKIKQNEEILNKMKKIIEALKIADKDIAIKIMRINLAYLNIMIKTKKAIRQFVPYHEDEEFPYFGERTEKEQEAMIKYLKEKNEEYREQLIREGKLTSEDKEAIFDHYYELVNILFFL